MKHPDAFSAYHPLVNLSYFVLVLLFAMFLMHPVFLAVSLLCSTIYAAYINGRKALLQNFGFLLPMALLTAGVNVVFNHRGATILTYLPSGNPLTLESIYYALAASAMLCAVVLWFSCFNAVITSDKFVYLFGQVLPALSLVLSMTLRFVPKFRAQLGVFREAQKCVGRDAGKGNVLRRIKNGVTILSVMVTWALENAIETADSMKSRGYGLPGRTAFSIYRFDKRDKLALLWLGLSGFFLCCGWAVGGLYWSWYPTVKGAALTSLTAVFQIVYLALCMTPLIINWKEDRAWKRLRSDI